MIHRCPGVPPIIYDLDEREALTADAIAEVISSDSVKNRWKNKIKNGTVAEHKIGKRGEAAFVMVCKYEGVDDVKLHVGAPGVVDFPEFEVEIRMHRNGATICYDWEPGGTRIVLGEAHDRRVIFHGWLLADAVRVKENVWKRDDAGKIVEWRAQKNTELLSMYDLFDMMQYTSQSRKEESCARSR